MLFSGQWDKTDPLRLSWLDYTKIHLHIYVLRKHFSRVLSRWLGLLADSMCSLLQTNGMMSGRDRP